MRWCLDTGHLLIGGFDPVRFATEHADRVGHVHLKDVDASLAERVRRGELTLVAATRLGLFRPLGEGDARVAEVLDRLGAYDGWLVLEQDVAITAPADDVRRSIEFLVPA